MRTRTPLSSLLLLGTLSITTACSPGSSEPASAGPPRAAAESSSPVHSVDPSRIKGLRIVSNGSEQRSCPFATSYPDVPGAAAMTAAMKRDVEQRLATFREGACGTDAFITTLKDELKGREGFDATIFDGTLSDPASRVTALDNMAFTADGGLRVTFDSGEVGAPPAGTFLVSLSRKTVTPWLSAFGKRAQRQTLAPSRSLALGASSTPTAAVPTHTASGDDDTDCKQVRCIALTFDDGPAAPETATLLTYLAQYKARATFFTTGQNVAAHPDLVRAEARAGHEVGNHSWNHPDLTKLTPAQIASQLHRTSAAIRAATGKEPTHLRASL